MKLSAKNFQSWEEFKLNLGKLTVLVGPSDTGKSAIFRSIMGLVRNEIEADQIRVGEDETEVSMEIGGHTFTIKRAVKSSNKYLIDGKPLKHGGTDTPEEIKKLNMGVIQIGDMNLDPIFSAQHDSKFMLQGVGPTQMNSILGAFSSTEKLEMGKREANARVVQKNQEAKALAGEVNDAETRKHKLGELHAKTKDVVGEVELLEWTISQAEDLSLAYKETAASLNRLTPIRKTIDDLTIPDLQDVVRLEAVIVELDNCFDITQHSKLLTRIVQRINKSQQLWDDLMDTVRVVSQLYNTAEILETKKDPADLVDAIDSVISNSDNLIEEYNDTREKIKYLNEAASFQDCLNDSQQRLEAAINFLRENQERETELMEQLEAERRQADTVTCPKCGANFCVHEEVNV